MDVRDKVFVVTGAGSGIGRELSFALLRRGARVAGIDLNSAALQETESSAAVFQDSFYGITANVSDRKAVETLPAKVLDKYGSVDGLINNAGIIQPFVRIKDLEYESIERILNVNFYGTLYMTKASRTCSRGRNRRS